ncbi:MAG: nucleoside monophosphate kinase [Candidatus Saccharibacteria bacterium]
MILFFGPAGSGKSVQAQLLVDKNGWQWLSMGQLLRDTPDPEVHNLQIKGILVPTEKTNQVLDAALAESRLIEGRLILDGYPRDLKQAQWLLDDCKKYGITIKKAINFEVPLEELLKRMELRGRSDDNPEAIKERLAIYHREIDPILELLAANSIDVQHVDGTGSPDEIHDRVVEKLA